MSRAEKLCVDSTPQYNARKGKTGSAAETFGLLSFIAPIFAILIKGYRSRSRRRSAAFIFNRPTVARPTAVRPRLGLRCARSAHPTGPAEDETAGQARCFSGGVSWARFAFGSEQAATSTGAEKSWNTFKLRKAKPRHWRFCKEGQGMAFMTSSCWSEHAR
jgi:hypothetical protein